MGAYPVLLSDISCAPSCWVEASVERSSVTEPVRRTKQGRNRLVYQKVPYSKHEIGFRMSMNNRNAA